MARPKQTIDGDTVLKILRHFGAQADDVRRPFMKSAGLKASDLRTAATSGSTPTQGRKKIVSAAKANGWEGP